MKFCPLEVTRFSTRNCKDRTLITFLEIHCKTFFKLPGSKSNGLARNLGPLLDPVPVKE
jgi:hypothetical protein